MTLSSTASSVTPSEGYIVTNQIGIIRLTDFAVFLAINQSWKLLIIRASFIQTYNPLVMLNPLLNALRGNSSIKLLKLSGGWSSFSKTSLSILTGYGPS